MPGRIFTKIIRTGYVGQVVTAGMLLTVAALLMFAVISTLEPAAKPPVAKKAPVSEPLQQAQSPTLNSLSADPVNAVPASPASQPKSSVSAPVEVVDIENNAAADSQAISELWNGVITQKFGWRLHPLYQDWRYHNGVDIAGSEGKIVPSLVNGKVIEIYTDKEYGLTAVVKSANYLIYYSSLASVAVQENTIIKRGRPIGSMGITQSEPEPHLHLAVQTQDKQEYLAPHEIFPNIPE
ncbi:M23 family metallopeptidase [Sporomusa sp. KB1]|jgi:murein DD-endopeptidase MepM/ murein hydrolase activator NlpD|uniref:M23 family metallopeptidase n=1 Tax=Sporomusa sp. KB1 TaxID=943346 RepID=UPI00119FF488|nr:M23 family metallopeptidase [Sporomusa sp. KB1]TWH45361.1 murein DD-endopeptidase MepM/ murein hydrolase activator NlpD [Sporomusa sp. KB1]